MNACTQVKQNVEAELTRERANSTTVQDLETRNNQQRHNRLPSPLGYPNSTTPNPIQKSVA